MSEVSTMSTVGVVRRLLGIVRPLTATLAVSFAAGVAGHLAAIGLMALGAVGLVDAIVRHEVSPGIVMGMFGLAVARGAFHYVEQYTGHDIAFRSLAVLRDRSFAALRRVSPAGVPGLTSGEIAARVMDDVEVVEVFFAHTIVPVGIGAVVSAAVVVAVAPWSVPVAALLAALLIAVMVLPPFVARAGRDAAATYRDARGVNQAHVLDSVRGVRELTLLGAEERAMAALRTEADAVDSLQRGAAMRTSIGSIVPTAIVAASPLLVGFVGSASGLAPGVILVLAVTVASSFGPAIAVSRLTTSLSGVISAARRILELDDLAPRVADISAVGVAADTSGALTVSDLSYTHPGASTPALSGVSFAIDPGEKVLISGPSGAGKSTLLSLLLRFDDPSTGEILLSGRDVRTIPLAELRRAMVLVTQETFLFSASVADNVRLGKADATDGEVWDALERVGAAAFVSRLPDGIDSPVGPAGALLSGGERQRIGLARALVSGAPIVVLDEPTSNLDSWTERHILEAIDRVFAERTMIVTSHRESVAEWVDRVIPLRG